MTTAWRPSLGAWPEADGVRFRVWAPAAAAVSLEIEAPVVAALGMTRDDQGYHTAFIPGLRAGARYRYRLDGGDALPDPASRFQPEGVHGPSEVVDPAFAWTDGEWRGLDPDAAVLYELHVGTFTPEATYHAAADRLDHLAELGVTAIQVMPVADFPGRWNWGYDSVDLYAPSRAYGRPEDLQALVDRAHAMGLGVILDVVYNHFGPDGAYHERFSPAYFTERHRSPWGRGVNLDGEGSEHVRAFFIESALHWLHEFHVDGFRLDAVHVLMDDGPRHFLAEFRDRLDGQRREGQPSPFLLAEEHRNLAATVRPRAAGGLGYDATYADDWHHEVQSILAGDDEGYYRDFRGSTEDLATALRTGWIYSGQFSAYHQAPRGTDPEGVPLPRFMHCLHNHDQIGNRPFGDRLYHAANPHGFRAATALLLFSAATPALFQGDEWMATQPFVFFTDHAPEIGRLVSEGHREELKDWRAFADPRIRAHTPDPQDPEVYRRCVLDWSKRDREPHASWLRYHQTLLRLRREEPALRWRAGSAQDALALDGATIAVRRTGEDARPMLLLARLVGSGPIASADAPILVAPGGMRWEPALTSEDAGFVLDPLGVEFSDDGDLPWCHFRRPGAMILRAVPREVVA